MNILNDFRNDLLKRREIEFVFSSDENPGSAGALKTLATEGKFSEESAVIKAVYGNYGSKDFHVKAFVYDSADDMILIEPKKKEKKK